MNIITQNFNFPSGIVRDFLPNNVLKKKNKKKRKERTQKQYVHPAREEIITTTIINMTD